MADREGYLRKIQALLDRADHPNTPLPEAESARRKADELMMEWRIELWEIDQRAPTRSYEPVAKNIPIWGDGDVWENDSEVISAVITLVRHLAEYCNVKVGALTYRTLKVVGFPNDIAILELMLAKMRIHISSTLDPKPDPLLPWAANLAVLKETGRKWEQIHHMLSEANLPDYPYNGEPWARRIGVRFTKVYTDLCERTGQARMYDSPQVWRRDFLTGYVNKVYQRLKELQSSRTGYSDSKALVLANMEGRLLEKFYEMFPDLRPHDEATCDCDYCHYRRGCSDRSCKRSYCKDRDKPVRYRKVQPRASSMAARVAGASAGSKLDLSKGSIGDRPDAIGSG